MDNQFLTYVSDVLGDTKKGLSGSEIAKYSNEFAVKNNVEIPYANYPFPKGLPNKKTALRNNMHSFSAEQQFKFIAWLCDMPYMKKQESVQELRLRLFSRYGSKYQTIEMADPDVVKETQHWLDSYPNALETYNDGIMKFESQIFERNCVDDIRLAYEMLLKELLDNDKSLEKQKSIIGTRLKEKNISPQLRNMHVKLLDYYTKYQNTYIKHDDQVNKNEIEYVIELTSLMMKFSIKMLK